MSEANPWPKVSADFVQKNLEGHKLLGLALCAILYLVCLSGTATVFYVEMERWETPRAPQVTTASAEVVAAALADARAARPNAKSLGVAPPTPELQRLVVAADEEVRLYDGRGRYAGDGDHPLTHGLTDLHYALSLPGAVGLPVVGLAGLGLVALVAGGLLAHPRILRDAFLWRWRSGPRLAQADLHNRIGVWAAPFHLMISLTGAVIGLASLLMLAAGLAFHGGDAAKASAALFGPGPATVAEGRIGAPAIVTAYAALERARPGAAPSYMALNNLGTDHESLTVTVRAPDRLAYGETYEFDGAGRLTGTHGLTDGPVGKQVYASLYKLHFGSYGGLWLKWGYLLLGAALSLVCVSGMELWLIKSEQQRRPHPRLRRLWAGFVWAAPAAMALAGVATLSAGASFAPVFWSVALIGALVALAARDHRLVGVIGRVSAGGALLALVAAHAAKFGADAAGADALAFNLSLTALGVALCALALRPAVAAKKSPLPAGEERAL